MLTQKRGVVYPTTVLSCVDSAKAHNIAHIFRRHPHVQEVLLFGSVARCGLGNDLDLILITDETRANDFVQCLNRLIEEFENRMRRVAEHSAQRDPFAEVYHHKRLRLEAIEETLEAYTDDSPNNFLSLYHSAQALVGHNALDLFLFPPDWRTKLEDMQKALPNRDPMFMQNVARDAIRIA